MQVFLHAVSLRVAVSEPSGGYHDAGGCGRVVAPSLLTAAAAYITVSRSSVPSRYASSPRTHHCPSARLTFDNPIKHHRRPLRLANRRAPARASCYSRRPLPIWAL